MTGILRQLKRESLKKRRRDSGLIMLYKCLKGLVNDCHLDVSPVNNSDSDAYHLNFPFHHRDIPMYFSC